MEGTPSTPRCLLQFCLGKLKNCFERDPFDVSSDTECSRKRWRAAKDVPLIFAHTAVAPLSHLPLPLSVPVKPCGSPKAFGPFCCPSGSPFVRP